MEGMSFMQRMDMDLVPCGCSINMRSAGLGLGQRHQIMRGH